MNNSFKDLGISPPILKALEEMGFEDPTEVQSRVIPHIFEQEDLIVMSKTGSGKTAVFGIPILQMADPETENPQCLILTPTRELAVQIDNELKKMSAHLAHRTTAVYGQHSLNVEIQELKKGVSIVTGTPGRVFDHIRHKSLMVKNIQFLVLDEADRMLDMGFIDQVFQIIRSLPRKRITLLFSATIPPEIQGICRGYMKNPVTIEMESDTKTVDTIEQRYYRVKPDEKRTQLHNLLITERPESCLIFCNTKIGVDRVQSFLKKKGYASQAIHGDIPQGKRLRIIEQFKKGDIPILIATDIAARGIHVDDLALVINYDVPLEKDNYVHRIGRTGRAGKGGRAITLVTGEDIMSLYAIEEHVNTLIMEATLPSESELSACREEAENWIKEKFRNSILDEPVQTEKENDNKKRKSKRRPKSRPSSEQSADFPKEDRPKSNRPKPDRSKSDRPKSDRPRPDHPKSDRPRPDHTKQDRPKYDRPRPDRPKPEYATERPEPKPYIPEAAPAVDSEKKPLLKRIFEKIKKS